MSTAAEPTATLQERSAEATRMLCQTLDLGALSTTELKYLALALMQVATDECRQSPDFAVRIRELYSSLVPQKTKPRAIAPQEKPWQVKLTPVGTVDEALLDPYGPPNPFALQQLYGDAQLALALGRYTPAKLKDAVVLVQQRYPGTKPKKSTKASIIEYIVSTISMAGTSN